MKSIDPRLQRLAFVQGWSDDVITHFLTSCEMRGITEHNIFLTAQKAAEDLNISVLREGTDPTLMESAALTLGFESASAMKEFSQQHPILSVQLGAAPALPPCTGSVVAMSMTEVVIKTEDGQRFAFERARLHGQVIAEHDVVTVDGVFSPVTKQPAVEATPTTAVDETASPGF